MASFKKLVVLPSLYYGLFFISFFIYFFLFNRYHLAFQEQIQLFRYNCDYFTGFLARPGGLSFYIGAFFNQFYVVPVVAASIVTLSGITICLLTSYILRKHNISGIFWSIIPVLLVGALYGDYLYNIGYSIGFILALSAAAIYISITKEYIRYAAGIISLFFLYFLTGGFSLLATVFFIIHEFIFSKGRPRFFVSLGYVIAAISIPYLACHSIYFIPKSDTWLYPVLFPFDGITKILLLLLLAYSPLLLIVVKIWMIISKKTQLLFSWSWKTVIVGMIFSLIFSWGIIKYTYDTKTETLFRIDYYIQHSEWRKALENAARYPGTNRLVTYFANLSLYKTGQMGNSLFHFNHTGKDDLWLEWPGGKLSLFFGSEVFYHLGYFNEGYRRAYDAMVLTGQNPRSLKLLAKISIVNGNDALAEKHLEILGQTLFYRKWSRNYRRLILNNELMQNDLEITEKRHLLLDSDFLVDTNDPEKTLLSLLHQHLDNRMAYEYLMASLLLDKNLTAFTSYITSLKSFHFKELPVHYEEAMLVYMSQIQMNIVPEGYKIRETTIRSFKDYFNDYSNARSSFSGDLNLMARKLNKNYSKTYWYYLNFTNNKTIIR
jgi:hypothetical protein